MTVQDHGDTGVPMHSVKNVEVYDFRRPTTLAREHARVLELAFDTFARQWGTQLTTKVRVRSQVSCESVQMLSYDEYAASLPPTTAMVLCTLAGLDAKMVAQFPTAAALSWVAYMVGGGATPAPSERKLTQIEHALVRRVMDDTLEDLRYSFGSLLLGDISVDTIHYNSQFAQAAATTDLMVVALFTIRVGEGSAVSTLAIPADALLPQLGETNPTAMTAGAADLMSAQLETVPVDVSLRLTPASVMPQHILELAVGDIVPLPHPHHRPLDIAVDGQPLARAAVGANGSRLACVVVDS